MRHNGESRSLAWLCGAAGLVSYNWWVLVPFKAGLMRSPNEFFSNLEVAGQPYAIVMQRADVAAGVLLVAAFVLAGNTRARRERADRERADRERAGRERADREWLGMVVFAMAGVIGGLFPQVCADGISASCRIAERHFHLPLSQYVHDGAGVLEFAGITLALWLAFRRTRGDSTPMALAYRTLMVAAAIGYPLLGLTYLLNVLGGVVEAVFFTGFTAVALLQLAERLHGQGEPRGADGLSPDHNRGMIGRNSVMREPDGSDIGKCPG